MKLRHCHKKFARPWLGRSGSMGPSAAHFGAACPKRPLVSTFFFVCAPLFPLFSPLFPLFPPFFFLFSMIRRILVLGNRELVGFCVLFAFFYENLESRDFFSEKLSKMVTSVASSSNGIFPKFYKPRCRAIFRAGRSRVHPYGKERNRGPHR